MAIGALRSMNSLYRVSRDHRLIRSRLTEKGRGRSLWKAWLPSGITVLSECYGLSLYLAQSASGS